LPQIKRGRAPDHARTGDVFMSVMSLASPLDVADVRKWHFADFDAQAERVCLWLQSSRHKVAF
jgi:hypothetical protein